MSHEKHRPTGAQISLGYSSKIVPRIIDGSVICPYAAPR